MFFKFLKLHKWYQIAQSVSYLEKPLDTYVQNILNQIRLTCDPHEDVVNEVSADFVSSRVGLDPQEEQENDGF